MGNRFFERVRSIEVVSSSLQCVERFCDERRHKSLVVGWLMRVADFWLFLVRASMAPLSHTFDCRLFNIDSYAGSIFNFFKHNSFTSKFQVSTIITSTQHLLTPTDPLWFSNLADAVLYFPSSIIVPYRSINNSIWFHENDQLFVEYIGYVPIHPNDLINMWNSPSKLCYKMMYASR